MRCLICGFHITSEVPSPTGQGPAYRCWRYEHIFVLAEGWPVILVPGPCESSSLVGQVTVVPCPICESSATCDDTTGPYPKYACQAGHQFQFNEAAGGSDEDRK